MVAGSVVYQPDVNFTLISADQPIANAPQRILLVGQKTSSGSAGDGAWVRDIGNANEEIALFGRDSMLAEMVRTVKRYAPFVALDAIALADHGSGVARVAVIDISGTATAQGSLTFRVGSDRRSFTISVPSGTSAATVLSAAAAAINADPEVPFTVTVVSSELTFTAVNDGTVANGLGIEVSGSVAGITVGAVTISGGNAVTGAQDPDLSNILDAIGETRYQAIVWPYSAATEEVTELLDARWNANGPVADGVAFTAAVDTYANIVTLLATADKNSLALVTIVDEVQSETSYKGPAIVEPPYVLACAAAAIRAARLTAGASVARFLTAAGPRDQYGGAHLASLPYFNTLLPELSVPRAGRGFTRTEIEALSALGGAIVGQNIAGSGLILGEMVTTYLTNPSGAPDVTWHYLNQVDTFSAVREYMQTNLRAIFAQSRLTLGATIAGHSMANEDTIRGVMKKLYNDLAGVGYALLAAGEEAITFFEDNLTIEIDLAAGQATIACKAIPVGQLRILQITMQVAFSTAG